jgi:HK97 family phage portal protein
MFNFIKNLFGINSGSNKNRGIQLNSSYISLFRDSSKYPTISDIELYNNSLVQACINKISNEVLSAPLITKNQMNVSNVKNRKLFSILNNSNTETNFISTSIDQLLTYGFSIWYVNDTNPVSVSNMPCAQVFFELTGKLNPMFFPYFLFNSQRINFEDVIFLYNPHPQSPGQFASPSNYAKDQIMKDMEKSKFELEYLKNTAFAGLLLSIDDQNNIISDESLKNVTSGIYDKTGNGNRGHGVILPFKVNKVDQDKVKDVLDWSEFNLSVESRICASFGVPPQLVGCEAGLRYSTYANYETARKAFITSTVRPMWKNIQEQLTREIFYKHDIYSYKIEFDLSNLNYLDEHREEVELFQAGIIDIDEARERLGYAPIGVRKLESVNKEEDKDESEETDNPS